MTGIEETLALPTVRSDPLIVSHRVLPTVEQIKREEWDRLFGDVAQIYNLRAPEYVQVNDSIRFICGALGLKPELRYTGGDRGWIADNPFIFLDTQKIQATGWKPKLTIQQGILRTLTPTAGSTKCDPPGRPPDPSRTAHA